MSTILVADDNSNIQKMVALALKHEGIDVVSVGNGEAAVRKLPELSPDVVLADIFMPVRNGYEVCEFVKHDPRFSHIPVVLLVGAFDPLDELEAQRVGADGVLKKPFVPPEPLIAMVKSLLAKSDRELLVPVAAPVGAPVDTPSRNKSATPSAATRAEQSPAAEMPSGPARTAEPEPEAESAAPEEQFGVHPERISFGGHNSPLAFGDLLQPSAPESETSAAESQESSVSRFAGARLGEMSFWRSATTTEEHIKPEDDQKWRQSEPLLARQAEASLPPTEAEVPRNEKGPMPRPPAATGSETAQTEAFLAETGGSAEDAPSEQASSPTETGVPLEHSDSYFPGLFLEEAPIQVSPAVGSSPADQAPPGEAHAEYLAPGVYVEETPFSSHPIPAVNTTEDAGSSGAATTQGQTGWQFEQGTEGHGVLDTPSQQAHATTQPQAEEPATSAWGNYASEVTQSETGAPFAPASMPWQGASAQSESQTASAQEVEDSINWPSSWEHPAKNVSLPEIAAHLDSAESSSKTQSQGVQSFPVPQPADPEVVEAIVSKVLERMQTQIVEIVTREILKPVAEALVRRELEKL